MIAVRDGLSVILPTPPAIEFPQDSARRSYLTILLDDFTRRFYSTILLDDFTRRFYSTPYALRASMARVGSRKGWSCGVGMGSDVPSEKALRNPFTTSGSNCTPCPSCSSRIAC